jgi:LPXTG-motif cell wall-anchored protein
MVFDGYNGFGAVKLARPLIRTLVVNGVVQPISDADLAPYINEAKILLARALDVPMQPLDGVWAEADGKMLMDFQRANSLRGLGLLGGVTWAALLGLPKDGVETTRPGDGGRPWDPPTITPEDLKPKTAGGSGGNTMLYVGIGAAVLAGILLMRRK